MRLEGPFARHVAIGAVEVAACEYDAPGFGIEPGQRVVDAGANIGAFAVLAARSGAVVTAFEPQPQTFAALERNVAALNVTCVRAALVSRVPDGGEVLLDQDSDASTHHAIGPAGVPVPAISFTEVIGQGCDLLKLDCEGAEFDLVAGTPDDVLRRARRIACCGRKGAMPRLRRGVTRNVPSRYASCDSALRSGVCAAGRHMPGRATRPRSRAGLKRSATGCAPGAGARSWAW